MPGPLPCLAERVHAALPVPHISTGMLTITDFINILHRYYRSPLVSAVRRAWGIRTCMGQAVPTTPGPFLITRQWPGDDSRPDQHPLVVPLLGLQNVIPVLG